MKNETKEMYKAISKDELIELLIDLESRQEAEVTCEHFDYKSSGKKRGHADLRYKNILYKKCTLFQEQKDGKIVGSIQLPCHFFKDKKDKWITTKLVEMNENEFKQFEAKSLEAVMKWCKQNPKTEQNDTAAHRVNGVSMNEII